MKIKQKRFIFKECNLSCDLLPAGFTLAEVLITLGIIGVVSAMTLPTLMANINGKKFGTQFKKSVSTLTQAAKLNEANYGWNFAAINKSCGNDAIGDTSGSPLTTMTACSLINGNLQGVKAVGSTAEDIQNYAPKKVFMVSPNMRNTYTLFYLAEGSIVGIRSGAVKSGNCTLLSGENLTKFTATGVPDGCTGFIDVNGAKLPNEETICTTGTTSRNPEDFCIVKQSAIRDIYPIVFHDAMVEPASNAAKYVFQNSK